MSVSVMKNREGRYSTCDPIERRISTSLAHCDIVRGSRRRARFTMTRLPDLASEVIVE
jgi:hypothetical protein